MQVSHMYRNAHGLSRCCQSCDYQEINGALMFMRILAILSLRMTVAAPIHVTLDNPCHVRQFTPFANGGEKSLGNRNWVNARIEHYA